MEWNITKCRAKYKGNKEANFTFWIVDYFKKEDIKHFIPASAKNVDDLLAPLFWDVIEMRNEGMVKTKYFRKEKEALSFISALKFKNLEMKEVS